MAYYFLSALTFAASLFKGIQVTYVSEMDIKETKQKIPRKLS